jgi:transcriptional regulator with XRE-family HTH domain
MGGWRRAAGVTQAAMAGKMGLSQSQVAKIESGDRRIDPVEFARWCRVCGLTPAEAMARAGL